MLRGVALAQAGDSMRATDSFREAVRLSPGNAKAHFNLAKHLSDVGERMEAEVSARQALELDPSNAAARELLDRLGAVAPPMQAPTMPTMAPPPDATQGVYYRPGYGPQEAVHSIAFVERMGSRWTLLGWILVATGLALFLMGLGETVTMFQRAMQDPNSMNNFQYFGSSVASMIRGLLSLVVMFATLGWMIVDIMDRRGNWVWMVPFTLCCCCTGAYFIVPGIYLLAERKK